MSFNVGVYVLLQGITNCLGSCRLQLCGPDPACGPRGCNTAHHTIRAVWQEKGRGEKTSLAAQPPGESLNWLSLRLEYFNTFVAAQLPGESLNWPTATW
jgi:hypothetical protein